MRGYTHRANKLVICQRYQHTSLLNTIKTEAGNIFLKKNQKTKNNKTAKTKGFHSKSHFDCRIQVMHHRL